MADFNVIIDKLHGFETADELADYFRYCGIKAIPGDARSCAITVFVEDEMGVSGQIVTSTDCIELHEEVVESYGHGYTEVRQMIRHTDAMKKFVKAFDKEEYPELIIDGYESVISGCMCYSCNNAKTP